MEKIFIVLPAYNEAKNIASLLDKITDAMSKANISCVTIVVNDGSTDGTAAILENASDKLPIHIITHSINCGLGTSLKDGINYALEKADEHDVIVTMDADDTHSPVVISTFLEKLKSGASVVIASRYKKESGVIGVPLLRKILSNCCCTILGIVFPIHRVKDYTSGYRAYTAKTLKKLREIYQDKMIEEKGFACQVEILLKLRRLNVSIQDVPFLLRYDLKKDKSKIKILKTILQYVRVIAKNIFGANRH